LPIHAPFGAFGEIEPLNVVGHHVNPQSGTSLRDSACLSDCASKATDTSLQ